MPKRSPKRRTPDTTFKTLFDSARSKVLRVLLPHAPQIIRALDSVLPASELRTDVLLLVRHGRTRSILHIEFQTRREDDDDMGARVFHYAAAAHRRYRLPVRSIVVVLLGPPPPPSEHILVLRAAKRVLTTLRFEVVHLPSIRLDPERALRHPALAALLPLTRAATADMLPEIAERIRGARWSRGRKRDALSLFTSFAELRFGESMLSSLTARVPMLQEIIESTSLYRSATKRAKAKGLATGLAKGRAQGILAVLKVRHIPVGAGARQRILACQDGPTLERWTARALTVRSASELFKRSSQKRSR